MKREIPPWVAVLVIVVVIAIAGFFYARQWFEGPKRISGNPSSRCESGTAHAGGSPARRWQRQPHPAVTEGKIVSCGGRGSR
jgi:hypothetical protein